MQKFFHFAHLKPTFSILHFYFYKTLTSVCLLYTFIQIKYSFFYHFLLFSSLPLSPSQTHPPPSSVLPDRRTIQDQTNPRSETHLGQNPLNPKAKSSLTQPKTHWSNNEKSMSWLAAIWSGFMLQWFDVNRDSGLNLIYELIGDNGLILIKWEKRRVNGEWLAVIWSGGVWFDVDRQQWCDVD